MTDQEKARAAIQLLLQTCHSVADSMSTRPNSLEHPPLSVLQKDLLSLLSLIYGSVTKLSLALKPSSPTYSACLVPIQDLSNRMIALSHCINMFSPSEHGATLTKEMLSIATNLTSAVGALASTLLEIERSGQTSGGDYLVRTGTVHDIIETTRSKDGLSIDNLIAVRRIWQQDIGPLEDGIREVEEMLQDAQSEANPEEDDGWDELGIGPSKPLTEEESKRAAKVLNVLRLCNVLHKKVISDVLSGPPSSLSNNFLDKLASLSPTLLSTSDELISTLDSPHDVNSITAELSAVQRIVDDIRNLLSSLKTDPDLNALTGQLAGTSLTEKAAVPTNRNPREKWLNACFDQITKAVQLAAT
ncbi:hypothetical protein D9757_001894 [Collybiopsis confluens]|uniref:Grap2 and cyclin-D-interacting-domain-containing protein n=1 Tax=Collybiopsis confluens TaxID=2823264 RepID=A0A8H5MEE6_9AGAR|nr:hypothetical protein D9757_001894 [Collybiopsis confluens]